MAAWAVRVLAGLLVAVAGCGRGTPYEAAVAAPATDGPLYPVRVREKWGYMDGAGRIVIAPHWNDAEAFSEGLAVVGERWREADGGVSRGRTRQGWIDRTGRLAIPLRYDDAAAFVDGLARFTVDERVGFVDRDGREVIAAQYEDAADFREGLAAVRRDGKTGFIDRGGTVVIPFRYERLAWIASFADGRACAFVRDERTGDERAGYLDRTGRMVIPPRYVVAQPFSEGLALVQREYDRPIEFIDPDGRTAFTTDGGVEALGFAEGLAAVRTSAGWSWVDRTGAVAIGPLPYRHAGIFREGRAGVARGMQWGFIDRTGREVIPTRWAGISLFRDGLARMEAGHLFTGLRIHYIDRDGHVVWREP